MSEQKRIWDEIVSGAKCVLFGFGVIFFCALTMESQNDVPPILVILLGMVGVYGILKIFLGMIKIVISSDE